jgi:hypothetical protein
MRYALVLAAAALLAPAALRAADAPPITFQAQPFDRLLADLRSAADLVGGDKAVKALNEAIKEKVGDNGFQGLDLSRPVGGYVLLSPKPEDVTAVVAFPISGEKEFLALCDRWNQGEKAKDLGKGVYELPPLGQAHKARMTFANRYAYIAYGDNPEPALAADALVAPAKLYDPAETAPLAGKLHFDRLTPAVKAALVTVLMDAKKELLKQADVGDADQMALKPLFAEVEKLLRRYLVLLGGADHLALRVGLDPATGEATAELTLAPKPNTELAGQIAARKPGENRFAGLITPDTVAAFHYSAPLFAEELRAAQAALAEEQQKEMVKNVPEAAKGVIEELFKGQARTNKAGEGDFAAALRGPDKDGRYTAVAALSFDDPAAFGKALRKFIDDTNPLDGFAEFKWDAAKAGAVGVHTLTVTIPGLVPASARLFGDDLVFAFAFAPKGIYLALGPDSVGTVKDGLKAKPAVAPAGDAVVNPAKLAKFVEQAGGDAFAVERALGKENKLLSAASLRVASGKEVSVRFAINLRLIPRAVFQSEAADEK